MCILQFLYILYILVLYDNIFICVKFSVFLLLIMIKNHRNINHLNSLIFGSIENDRVDDLRHYISVYPSDKIENIIKQDSTINLNEDAKNLKLKSTKTNQHTSS